LAEKNLTLNFRNNYFGGLNNWLDFARKNNLLYVRKRIETGGEKNGKGWLSRNRRRRGEKVVAKN